jgi:3D (Asp-Asp-Asp) domain-containing protein
MVRHYITDFEREPWPLERTLERSLPLVMLMRRRIFQFILALLLLVPGSGRGAGLRARRGVPMEATAFSVAARATATGTPLQRWIVAADPAVLPLGSRIRVAGAGVYSGIYLVADTGSKVRGRHIDVFIPSAAAAKRFGRKIVMVELLTKPESNP